MPNPFTDNTFSETYKDDFRDSDHYHRILFNNGRAVQQRELNQLQTIINKEVERFGRNIFKEGASVAPISNVFVNAKYLYVKVTQTSLPSVDLVGLTFTGQTSGVEAKILGVAPYVDANNPLTLFVEYVNTSSANVTPGADPITFDLSENVQNIAEGVTFTVQGGADALGAGTKASIGEGVFFVRGHFVYSQPQDIILSRYSSTPTTQLGFKVTEDIVTVNDTDALYDNVGGVPDLTSPGADRYRITLDLIAQEDIQSDEQFVYIAQVINGEVTDVNNGRREYNRIYEVMAERTFEESGNYTASPFIGTFEEDENDSSKLTFKVQNGVAYVRGYRAEPGAQRISVNKPTVSQQFTDEPVSASYGNYVLVSEPAGLFKVDEYENVTLHDAVSGGGNTLGSARVRSIESAGAGKYRLYLFEVTLTGNNAFRDVLSVSNGTAYADTDPNGAFPQLIDASNNDLFFDIPKNRPDWNTATSFDMTVQRTFTVTTNGSGVLTVDTGGNGTFTQTTEWLVFDNTNTLVNVPLVNFGATGGTSLDISGLNASESYSVLTLVDLSNVPPRTKTITTRSFQTSLDSDLVASLERADIIDLVSITDDSTSNDITSNFRLDNGARDNFYGVGRILLRPGRPVPATTITVNYRYYAHSTSGGYFFASSYIGNPGFEYSDIPQYTKADGTVIELRNVIDFRPTLDYTGNSYTNSAQGARINPLPKNTDTITSNISYYQPRKDILVVTIDEKLRYIEGAPSFDPEFPPVPADSMLLYQIELGANTVSLDDLTNVYVAQRGYTMEDIGRLDQRIRENRELITLSLLELETSTLEVLDENGLARTKAGFFVDNFKDTVPADTVSDEYNVFRNVNTNTMRPALIEKEVPYVYDSDASTNVIRKGSLVMLNYNNEVFIDQPVASGVINVNPFNVITNIGSMTLTPELDNWRDTTVNTSRVFVGPRTRAGFDVVGTNTSVTETSEEVTVNFMRSREVAVRVDGLMPFTRHFPFFDEVDVTNWCKQLTENEYDTLVAANFGENPPIIETEGQTERPDGFTAGGMTSDANGTLFFSYLIPDNDSIRFTTGTLELAVYDITSPIGSNSNSQAQANYTATGIAETIDRSISDNFIFRARPQPRQLFGGITITRGRDPIAQTFRNDRSHGVFVSQVGVYVATKDASRPLICELRPTVNGYPSATEVLQFGTVSKLPSEIITSGDATVETIFEFETPVYLEPFVEYAVVLRSESDDYFVWQATMGDFEVGSSEKRISAQPSMGSLFSSQNGSTWEPNQEQDLKFKLYVANFTTSGLTGTVNLHNANTLDRRLPANPFTTVTGSNLVRVEHPFHGMIEGDTVTLSRWTDADSANDGLTDFNPVALEQVSTIANVDALGYSVSLGSNATVDEVGGGDKWQATDNVKLHGGRHDVFVFQPADTTLQVFEKKTSIPSLMENPATGYSKDATRSETAYLFDAVYERPFVIASAQNETARIGGAKSMEVEYDFTTSNVYTSPVVSLQGAGFLSIENQIDWQNDSDATGRVVPYVFVEETDKDGGTSLSKYVSKNVVLESSSTGLQIIVGANVPTTAGFDMYYKTANEDALLEDQPWVLAEVETPQPNDDNPTVFREYRYLVGGVTGTLNEFTKFKVKIVMRSTSEARVPSFKDLRVIALSD